MRDRPQRERLRADPPFFLLSRKQEPMRPRPVILLVLTGGLLVLGPDRDAVRAQTPPAAKQARGGIKPIPGPGIEVSPADRQLLEAGLAELDAKVVPLRAKKDAKVDALLPDVLIYAQAVRSALRTTSSSRRTRSARPSTSSKSARPARISSWPAPARGPRKPAWFFGGTSRRSTGRSSRMAWSIPTDLHDDQPDPLPAGHLVPRARGGAERTELHRRTRAAGGPVRPGRHDRPPPLRPILQRLQVRGRGGCPGGPRRREARLQGRRGPDQRPGVLDGGGGGLAHGGPLLASRWFACNPGAGFAETARFVHAERDPVPATWYEKALYHLYDSHRLRRQPPPVSDRRLFRSDRRPEAGRRRDG